MESTKGNWQTAAPFDVILEKLYTKKENLVNLST